MKGRCEDILTALTQQSLTSKQLTLFTQELDQGFTLSLNNIKRAVKHH